MKLINYIILFIISPILLISCDSHSLQSPNTDTPEGKPEITYDKRSELKKDFAKPLAKALEESQPLRTFLKEEALKKFNKDFDILYHLVKNEKLSNSKTVRETLLKYFTDENQLSKIEEEIPLLTIFVPELPKDSFSAELWDTQNEIPDVAIRMTNTNHVPIFESNGEEYVLHASKIPAFPVVVIKENERVVVRENKSQSNQIPAKTLHTSESGIEFQFTDNSFNGTLKTSKSRIRDEERNGNERDRGDRGDRDRGDRDGPVGYPSYSPEKKVADAFNIYDDKDGWQRDYIYYNIKPAEPRGPFSYDFQEQIRTFRLNGNPKDVLTIIADQTGDPEQTGGPHKSQSSGWTDGNFEFKVKVLINSKNGTGETITKRFSAAPEDLFRMKPICGRRCSEVYLNPDDLRLKYMTINLPIFNWNLNEHSTSIKIEIEEIDLEETTTITDSRTVEYATNFSTGEDITEKIGLKFGASLKEVRKETIEKSYTKSNDKLGEVIVNFGDNVIIDDENGNAKLRKYSSGLYTIEVVPRKVQ